LLLASLFGETPSRARERIQDPAKAETVTVAKRGKGRRWRDFSIRFQSRPGVGPASSKRWGDGVRKSGEDKQLDFVPPAGPWFLILPGVCGKLTRTGHGIFPGSDNFPQSPSNLGAQSVRLEIGAVSWNEAGLKFRSGAIRGDFQPV